MNPIGKQRTRPVPLKQQQFARALGWFSIGLGAAQLIFPNTFARLIGVKRHRGLFRLLGLRELASGAGILTESKYPRWVQSRVMGDAMDLGLLGIALASSSSRHKRLAAVTAAVAGVTALDIICSEEMSRTRKIGGGSGVSAGKVLVKRAITINRPATELYQFWRNFENLPRVMFHVESVRKTGEGRSHWVVKGPVGKSVEWDSEITEDRPNELIAWKTLPGSDVNHTGVVRFEPATGGRATVVRVELEYKPPGGLLGAAFAKTMRRDPNQEMLDSLRYFRQFMETGVIPTTVGQSAGRPTSTSRRFDLPTPEPVTKTQPELVNQENP